MSEPKGVIAIWTDPDGRVTATKADFERQSYGGFKLWEAQRKRASDHVKWAAVKAYCSEVVTSCLSSYLMTSIADEMLQKGHRVTIRAIGHDDETSAAIER